MKTSFDTLDYSQQAFLAGIVLENCIRAQSQELEKDTTRPTLTVKTDVENTKREPDIIIKDITCKAIYTFMHSRSLYNIGSISGWYSGLESEHNFNILTIGSPVLEDNVCILSTPSSIPVTFLTDVPIDIKEPLLTSISLVNKYFANAQNVDVQWEQDPETDEKWISVEVTVEDEIDRVLDNYDNYTSDWIASTPWPEREKIRFSYNIL